jgi:hypothetical protein
VTESAGTATVVITKTGDMTSTAIDTLVNNLQYNNLSNDILTSNRIINLLNIQDDGGVANGGDDSSTLSVSSTITVINVIIPQNSTASILPDGQINVIIPQGRNIIVPDGSTIVENNDGTVTVTTANGSIVTVPSGSSVAENNDGTVTVTTDAGGVFSVPSGSVITEKNDGTMIFTDGFGNSITASNDAKISIIHDENGNIQVTDNISGTSVIVSTGSTITINSDDTITVIDQYGNKIISREYATTTIIDNNDGTITVSDNLTNDSVTAPNGSIFIVNPDGAITVSKLFDSGNIIYQATLLSSGSLSYKTDKDTYEIDINNITTTFEIGFIVIENNQGFKVFNEGKVFQLNLGANSTASHLINDLIVELRSLITRNDTNYTAVGKLYSNLIQSANNIGEIDIIQKTFSVTISSNLDTSKLSRVFLTYILSLDDKFDRNRMIEIILSSDALTMSDLLEITNLLRANGLNAEADQITEGIDNEATPSVDTNPQDAHNYINPLEKDKKQGLLAKLKAKLFSGSETVAETADYSDAEHSYRIKMAKAELVSIAKNAKDKDKADKVDKNEDLT